MDTATLLCRALIAYAVHEHQAGTAKTIRITLEPRACRVQDDGRGMGLDRDGYVAGLMEQLTPQGGEIALHGIGLAVIAMSTPQLRIASYRSGHVWTQEFAWGQAQGPPQGTSVDRGSGTTVSFTVPDGMADIDRDAVLAQVDAWRRTQAGLTIDVS